MLPVTLRVFLAVVSLTFAVGGAEPVQNYIWWEAEAPVKSGFPDGGGVAPATENEKDSLSGGDWLPWDNRTPGSPAAEYQILVPKDATYELWVRRFGQAAFEWRFDEDAFQPFVRTEVQSTSTLDITASRYFTAQWQLITKRTLSKGTHTFTIRMAPDQKPLGALDCFVLSEQPFRARGKYKPGEMIPSSDGWFTFDPGRDPLVDSPIDMLRFNDAPAGKAGRVARKGDMLVLGDTGKEFRAWGVTATDSIWRGSREQMDYFARRLAKMGVNLVRLHVAPYTETSPDDKQTAGIHYLVATLKKQGIYSGLNWYCLATARVDETWGLDPEFEKGHRPFALHLFYPPMQDVYRRWAKNLLGSVNPHTGVSLAKDPAVAFLELVDEDNYFFWTFDPAKVHAKALPYLERAYAEWVIRKHGSLEAALNQWGEGPKPKQPDLVAEGRLALYPAALLTGNSSIAKQRNSARASDQLRFMTEGMRSFYVGMKQWFADELGYEGLVLGTNWSQADPGVLGPLDYYANMGVDITARNTYFSAPHNQGRFHPWTTGDTFLSRSLLKEPEQALTMHMQYEGFPHFITEGGYTMPNRFRTEEQLVMAAYASLQGIDGMFPFVVELDWASQPQKWPIQTPATFAQYPAASLMFRQGYIDEGPVAVNERLTLESLYAFGGSRAGQPASFDGNRANDYGDMSLTGSSVTLDPLAFYTGRVFQTVGAPEPGLQVHSKLSELVDREKKRVRSATEQLDLDYGLGLLTVNAPRAQGVTGFLGKAGVVRTMDLEIEFGNEYGALMAVSLDDEPLAKSKRIFLQVMTEERPRRMETQPAQAKFRSSKSEVTAEQLTRLGHWPVEVRNVEGRIRFRREDAAKALVSRLDLNGYPVETKGGEAEVVLHPQTLYYMIQFE